MWRDGDVRPRRNFPNDPLLNAFGHAVPSHYTAARRSGSSRTLRTYDAHLRGVDP
jgi:hypothetical protein